MTNLHPTRPWTQQLAQLRARSLKLTSRPELSALRRLAEDAMATCAELLDDLGHLQVQSERLLEEALSAAAAHRRLFERMPCPSVWTDSRGTILHANAAAGRLLNVTSRRLEGHELLLYSQDRDAFVHLLANLPHGDTHLSLTLSLRPRERRPVLTALTVTPVSSEHHEAWLWFFTTTLPLPALDGSSDAPPVPLAEAGIRTAS